MAVLLAQAMLVLFAQIMVVLVICLKSLSCKLKKVAPSVLIQLGVCTLRSDNGGTLRAGNHGAGHLSKVTNSKLKKLIQLVFIQLVGCTLRSDNGGTLRAGNHGTGHLSKVTSSKLKETYSTCVNTVSRSYSLLR